MAQVDTSASPDARANGSELSPSHNFTRAEEQAFNVATSQSSTDTPRKEVLNNSNIGGESSTREDESEVLFVFSAPRRKKKRRW